MNDQQSSDRLPGMLHPNMSRVEEYAPPDTNEYRAAQLGLSGLAYGISRHDFITSKLERIGTYHERLQTFVGEDQAMGLVAETLESLPDTTTRQHILDLLPDEHGHTEATTHLEKQLQNNVGHDGSPERASWR